MDRSSYRFRVHLRLFCLLIAVLLGLEYVQQAKAQEDNELLKSRFLQDAPSQWEKYLHRARKLQGQYVSLTISSFMNMTIQDESEYRANAKGKTLKYVQHRRDDESRGDFEKVYGINPKYAFKIQRKTLNSPWLLIDLTDFGQVDNVPESLASLFDKYLVVTTPLVRLQHDLLSEAVRQPTFRVIQARKVQISREELVEVVFDYPHDQNERPPYNGVQSGRVLLDPSRYWIMRFGDLKAKNGTIKRNIVISETSDSFPVIKNMTEYQEWTFDAQQRAKGFPEKIKRKIRSEFTLEEPQRLPADEEFILSAFGLPEPALVGRPFPWYLVVAGAGTVCLGVFFFLRARTRCLRGGG